MSYRLGDLSHVVARFLLHYAYLCILNQSRIRNPKIKTFAVSAFIVYLPIRSGQNIKSKLLKEIVKDQFTLCLKVQPQSEVITKTLQRKVECECLN